VIIYSTLAIAVSSLDILDPDAAPRPHALSRMFDAAQKARVVFEPVVEPVVLGAKPMSTPAGFPLRVMTISSPSASRRNREKLFLISDSGTRLTPISELT